jgi:hypothetical protein
MRYAMRLAVHPLSFENALKRIVSFEPDSVAPSPKRRKKRKFTARRKAEAEAEKSPA